MKSLIVGAITFALIAGAAVAGQAYEGASNQPVKAAAQPNLLSKGTMNFSEKTVDPAIFDPSHSTPYRVDSTNLTNVQNVEKSAPNETAMPVQRVSNYRRSTTKTRSGN